MTTRSKILLGIVGAAAAGVAIGLLMYPEKTTELRSRITDKTSGWSDQLSDLFANAKDGLQNLTQKGSKAANSAAGNMSENFS